MQTNSQPADAREALLIAMMEQYGDEILRTCYLLCGDLPTARRKAQQVFLAAHAGHCAPPAPGTGDMFSSLLSLAIQICPCRFHPCRLLLRRHPVSRFLSLPPSMRRVALLCLYHGLSAQEAAQLLQIPTQKAERILRTALIRLNPPAA